MSERIDECVGCGTFQLIPFDDLYVLEISEQFCKDCLKNYLDKYDEDIRMDNTARKNVDIDNGDIDWLDEMGKV